MMRSPSLELPSNLDTTTALVETLHDLVVSGVLDGLLADILLRPEMCERVAARSYGHANGFDKLVLAEDEDNATWKLRLHAWPEIAQPGPLENIHNHRWDFASRGLEGSLEAEYFDVAEVADGSLDSFRYFSPETADQYRFEVAGAATATSDGLDQIGSETAYSLAYDVFHRVRPLRTPAMTVVLQGPVKRDHTTVLRHRGSVPVLTTVTRMCPDDIRPHLERARTLLAES